MAKCDTCDFADSPMWEEYCMSCWADKMASCRNCSRSVVEFDDLEFWICKRYGVSIELSDLDEDRPCFEK